MPNNRGQRRQRISCIVSTAKLGLTTQTDAFMPRIKKPNPARRPPLRACAKDAKDLSAQRLTAIQESAAATTRSSVDCQKERRIKTTSSTNGQAPHHASIVSSFVSHLYFIWRDCPLASLSGRFVQRGASASAAKPTSLASVPPTIMSSYAKNARMALYSA
jgi:hypothetical protein